MRIHPISVLFAALALLLIPMALNGCGTDHSDANNILGLRSKGIVVLSPDSIYHSGDLKGLEGPNTISKPTTTTTSTTSTMTGMTGM